MKPSFKHIILITGFTLAASFSFGQIERFRMFNLVENEGNRIIDSLKSRGIDTIVFYRKNVPQAFSTGSGKVIWQQEGVAQIISIESHNNSDENEEGAKLSLKKSKKLYGKIIMDYYIGAGLDTITIIPRSILWANYDVHHYFFATVKNKVYSFEMTGTTVAFAKAHPLGKLIDLFNK